MPAEGALRDRPAAGFDLIETLRWDPEGGFLRLDRHLARLHASAQALGFPADQSAISEALRNATLGPMPLRVRLALAPDGAAKVTTQPFEPLSTDAVWTLGVAAIRLDADDPLLRHKTTRRETYDAARAEFRREDADEVVLLNLRGEVCEGTITNIFLDLGDPGLVTPALSSGLLPGVLRGSLIDENAAREAVVGLPELGAARRIFVGNSLRGLIPARLAA